jgi:hypothetical protein
MDQVQRKSMLKHVQRISKVPRMLAEATAAVPAGGRVQTLWYNPMTSAKEII